MAVVLYEEMGGKSSIWSHFLKEKDQTIIGDLFGFAYHYQLPHHVKIQIDPIQVIQRRTREIEKNIRLEQPQNFWAWQ